MSQSRPQEHAFPQEKITPAGDRVDLGASPSTPSLSVSGPSVPTPRHGLADVSDHRCTCTNAYR